MTPRQALRHPHSPHGVSEQEGCVFRGGGRGDKETRLSTEQGIKIEEYHRPAAQWESSLSPTQGTVMKRSRVGPG
jgi:hypothetical protein